MDFGPSASCGPHPPRRFFGAAEWPSGSYVSLLRYRQFPVQSAKFLVSILREFGGNALNLFTNAKLHRPHRPQAAKLPCIFPQNREYRAGDGFADDCLHRQFLGRRHVQVAALSNALQTFRNGSRTLTESALRLRAGRIIGRLRSGKYRLWTEKMKGWPSIFASPNLKGRRAFRSPQVPSRSPGRPVTPLLRLRQLNQ